MSIFSKLGAVFTDIATFISNLFTSVKKEYLNLEPSVQAVFTNVIKFGNVIKTYLANPSSAGPLWSELIELAESTIGTTFTQLIEFVLNEVLLDLGIIQVALTNPVDAGQALLNHLSTFTGAGLGEEIYKIGSKIATVISGLDNNESKMIIAFVFKTFFQSSPVVAPAPSAPAPIVPAVTSGSTTEATLTQVPNETN